MHPVILEKRDQIIAVCEQLGVARLDLFGSAARGVDFDPAKSDADFLVVFAPETPESFYIDLKERFQHILGRPIDIIDRKAIEASRNYIRRRNILSQAEPIYVAR
jgi:predicted nucleotidyltransferase